MTDTHRDFQNWLDHYREKYPHAQFTIEDARAAYDEVYSCHCIGCDYRKEHGQWPLRLGTNCSVPLYVGEFHPKHVIFIR